MTFPSLYLWFLSTKRRRVYFAKQNAIIFRINILEFRASALYVSMGEGTGLEQELGELPIFSEN